jgi:Cu-processing system permease protein
MNLYSIFSIAKKEYMDNFRNTWIIILTFIFALLVLIFSYYGSQGFDQNWSSLDDTISALESVVILIIPIISLMLGYASIVGEIEKGSMSSLISLPVNRTEIIFGKFIGLGSVLCSTIFIGFITSGLIIAINVPNSNFTSYFIFIGISIIIALAFLSISIFFSTLFKKRSSAVGGAIFLWFFFAIIWQIILFGVLYASFINSGVNDNSVLPGWFYPSLLANPLMIFIAAQFPNTPPLYLRIISPILWIIIPFILTIIRFKNEDI